MLSAASQSPDNPTEQKHLQSVTAVFSRPTYPPYQLLSLPLPLLALVASHLPFVSQLHLQRSCRDHHVRRADDAYMKVAWRWTKLRLLARRLHEWTLPIEQCMFNGTIPVDMWQAALPVFRAVLAKAPQTDAGERHQRLRELVNQAPSAWLRIEHVMTRLHQGIAERLVRVSTVEVLRDIDWLGMADKVGAALARCGGALPTGVANLSVPATPASRNRHESARGAVT